MAEQNSRLPHTPDLTRKAAAFRPPARRLSTAPYRSAGEHLRDHLARIDLYVRAQVARWRLTIAADKRPEHWGMILVDDREIDRYVSSPIQPPDSLPPGLLHVLERFWKAAADIGGLMEAKLAASPPLPDRVDALTQAFNLEPLERDILLVCMLAEVDSRYRRIFGYLMDNATRTRPSVDLLLQILHPLAPALERRLAIFRDEARLVAGKLVRLRSESGNDDALTERTVCIEDRIVSFLTGCDAVDRRLRGIFLGEGGKVAWSELDLADDLRLWLEQRARDIESSPRAPHVVLFQGPAGSGRWRGAQAICSTAGVPLLRFNAAAAHDQVAWEETVELAYREATLRRAAVYWSPVDDCRDEQQSEARLRYVMQAALRYRGWTFFAGEPGTDAAAIRNAPLLRADFPAASFDIRLRVWQRELPATITADRAALAEALANAFQLTQGQIRESVAFARSLATRSHKSAASPDREDLYEACRKLAGRRLIAFATRIEPRRDLTLDNVILPAGSKRQLRELLLRIQHRRRVHAEMGFEQSMSLGKGLLALFVGPSGTGKTMSAEVLAREQRVDLYKVDLSSVMSKWLGETEKNLCRIFAEAEDSNAMLFFDEADSLYGKRTEVRYAQDRWANLEVNYLLQRVEEYSGVVIMATNLRQNIDEAFVRRIQAIVEFPFPDADARLQIWRLSLPPAPFHVVTESQLRTLAVQFPVAGGSIRNIVLDAAFRAQESEGRRIDLQHLIIATAREYQKAGKPVTQAEFGRYYESATSHLHVVA